MWKTHIQIKGNKRRCRWVIPSKKNDPKPPLSDKWVGRRRRTRGPSILQNGAKTENFKPTRGLRQGDRLSLYLIVTCMERFLLSIQSKVEQGVWRLVYVSKEGLGLLHLLTTDDVLLLWKTNPHYFVKIIPNKCVW